MAGWNGKMLACYIPYHSRDHLQVSACIVVTYGGFVCIFSCLYINTEFFYNSAYLFVFLLAEFSLAFCSLCFTFEHHDP